MNRNECWIMSSRSRRMIDKLIVWSIGAYLEEYPAILRLTNWIETGLVTSCVYWSVLQCSASPFNTWSCRIFEIIIVVFVCRYCKIFGLPLTASLPQIFSLPENGKTTFWELLVPCFRLYKWISLEGTRTFFLNVTAPCMHLAPLETRVFYVLTHCSILELLTRMVRLSLLRNIERYTKSSLEV